MTSKIRNKQVLAEEGGCSYPSVGELGEGQHGHSHLGFPFGMRGADTPFKERKEPVRRGQNLEGRDRALRPHSKESVPSNAPTRSISQRDGTGSSQATIPQAGISVPKEAFGHWCGLDLPRAVWSDCGSGGLLTDQKPQGPEWRCPGSSAML